MADATSSILSTVIRRDTTFGPAVNQTSFVVTPSASRKYYVYNIANILYIIYFFLNCYLKYHVLI